MPSRRWCPACSRLGQLAADLEHRGVHLVIARDIGQVRDMLALTADPAGTPQYFATVAQAVRALRPGPSGGPDQED